MLVYFFIARHALLFLVECSEENGMNQLFLWNIFMYFTSYLKYITKEWAHNLIIRRNRALKTVRCMVYLCPIHGAINT